MVGTGSASIGLARTSGWRLYQSGLASSFGIDSSNRYFARLLCWSGLETGCRIRIRIADSHLKYGLVMSVGLGVWIVLVSIGVRFGLELGIGVFWIGVLVLLGVGVSFAEIPRGRYGFDG